MEKPWQSNEEAYYDIKADLRFCPVCAWTLREIITQSGALTCPKHGIVFHIHMTINGYDVKVYPGGNGDVG